MIFRLHFAVVKRNDISLRKAISLKVFHQKKEKYEV